MRIDGACGVDVAKVFGPGFIRHIAMMRRGAGMAGSVRTVTFEPGRFGSIANGIALRGGVRLLFAKRLDHRFIAVKSAAFFEVPAIG